ncbi:hypothetical protein [Pseudomonas sp. PB106]|uniref:hypothetical protein n=1 Tax=Pseudomonas sp. PB106 TaxID=2494699 RepID=UPI00131DC67C|nr:hypothetical protein [Pseudomonas sp. PB106]KAE9649487.1 hypothetical protein EJA71_01865 [Pseudomonas sp. PB106]
MSDIRREEFNARIETIEARMDARVSEVSTKIDTRVSELSARIDTRVREVSARIDAFLVAQAERDKCQLERDKRYDLLSMEMREIARRTEESARQGATVKANVWAATAVQLVGIVAIVVGAYYANQANMYVAMQTTLAAIQAGKEFSVPNPFEFSSPKSPQ